jgi:hypothetical protein
MSPNPSVGLPPSRRPFSVLWLVVGVAFILLWLAGSIVASSMMLMGTLMANDSGEASSDAHLALVVGVFLGQVLIGISGIPGGLAFFWRRRRRLLVSSFVGLLIVGAATVAVSTVLFLQSAG